MTKDDMIETLAAVEHQRWADWQKYLHSKADPGPFELPSGDTLKVNGDLVLHRDDVEHWERQIVQPYAQLSEDEKQSDREQVMRYWPMLVEFVAGWLDEHDSVFSDNPSQELSGVWREEMR